MPSNWTFLGTGTPVLTTNVFHGTVATPSAMAGLETVAAISVGNGGLGYTSIPTVTITGNGTGATATATITNILTAITVGQGGTGYTSPPLVTISGGGGSGAFAWATIANGAVVSVQVVLPGSGFASAPTISFSAGGGSGATATATISGTVSGINITDPGQGYTTPPTISITGGDGSGATATATVTCNVGDWCFCSSMGALYQLTNYVPGGPAWRFMGQGGLNYGTNRFTQVVESLSDMLALVNTYPCSISDWTWRDDLGQAWMVQALPATEAANWIYEMYGDPAVTSGFLTLQSGAVVVNEIQTPDRSAYGTVLAGVNFPAGASTGSAVRLICKYTDHDNYAFAELAIRYFGVAAHSVKLALRDFGK